MDGRDMDRAAKSQNSFVGFFGSCTVFGALIAFSYNVAVDIYRRTVLPQIYKSAIEAAGERSAEQFTIFRDDVPATLLEYALCGVASFAFTTLVVVAGLVIWNSVRSHRNPSRFNFAPMIPDSFPGTNEKPAGHQTRPNNSAAITSTDFISYICSLLTSVIAWQFGNDDGAKISKVGRDLRGVIEFVINFFQVEIERLEQQKGDWDDQIEFLTNRMHYLEETNSQLIDNNYSRAAFDDAIGRVKRIIVDLQPVLRKD